MLTFDRSPVLVDEQVGRTRWLTPEGFLYCEGVRIARVGPMLYRQDEVPEIEPSGQGMITIMRDADVLFSADTIASFSGKPVTNDHPPEFVLPSTWRQHAIGTVLDPRRGEGVEADYLIADLLITDQDGIDDVLAGKREVSCGYDAPREQVKPGLGRQTKVVGNHVALVSRGRAGPACAIQDQEPDMAVKKRSIVDRIRTAFKANDEAALEEELESVGSEDPSEPQRIVIEVSQPVPAEAPAVVEPTDPLDEIKTSIAAIVARLDKLETPPAVDEDPEPKPEDKPEPPTMDAAALREAIVDARAKAEILSPGITLPTLDAKSEPKGMATALHDLRIRSLKAAYGDAARKPHVEAVLGGKAPAFDAMTVDAAETLFNAASAVAKAANRTPSITGRTFPQGPMTTVKYDEMIKARNAARR